MAENFLYRTALNKAMSLCASREMCNSDMKNKLISWGVREDDAEKIITVLKHGKFIDDERYAAAFVKDKFRQNKWGKIKITAALRLKRVPDDVIRMALDNIDDAEYIDLLKSIIEKQRKSVKAKNKYDLKGKLLRHCLSKGFESHLVYDILKEED